MCGEHHRRGTFCSLWSQLRHDICSDWYYFTVKPNSLMFKCLCCWYTEGAGTGWVDWLGWQQWHNGGRIIYNLFKNMGFSPSKSDWWRNNRIGKNAWLLTVNGMNTFCYFKIKFWDFMEIFNWVGNTNYLKCKYFYQVSKLNSNNSGQPDAT